MTLGRCDFFPWKALYHPRATRCLRQTHDDVGPALFYRARMSFAKMPKRSAAFSHARHSPQERHGRRRPRPERSTRPRPAHFSAATQRPAAVNSPRLRLYSPCGSDVVLVLWLSWRPSAALDRSLPAKKRCRSSVVEHSLGKGEVVSSILTGSTRRSSARSGRARATFPVSELARQQILPRSGIRQEAARPRSNRDDGSGASGHP